MGFLLGYAIAANTAYSMFVAEGLSGPIGLKKIVVSDGNLAVSSVR
jgi:hypothetical protein